MKVFKQCMAGLMLGSFMLTSVCVPVAAANLPTAAGNPVADILAAVSERSEAAAAGKKAAASTSAQPASEQAGDMTQTGQADDDNSIDRTDALALAVYYLYAPDYSRNLLPGDYNEFEFIPLYDDDQAVIAWYVKFSNGSFLIINNNKENPFVPEYGYSMDRSSEMIEMIMQRYPEMEIIYDGWNGVRGRDFDDVGNEAERSEINYHTCYPNAGDKDEEQMEILSRARGMLQDGELKPDENWIKEKSIEVFVWRLYETCLGREPDETGFSAWKEALNNGVRASKVVKGFFYSDEYAGKKKGSMQYIMDLYMAFVGRVFDAKGYQSWNEALYYGATRDQVFRGFARSEEFKKLCVANGMIP